ncbi:MAG: hypothetical protein GWN30_27745, partial [Gammaproteobacteria bacterium]|nr:hypothetical protein [Gammaproteobacteria bacterium]
MLAGNPKFDAIYPEWFGVTGDGTTDDTAAIQKAFNFLKSTGGAILFEPSRYAVTDQLEIELINGASIIGANRGEQGVIFDYNNATTEAFL